MPRVNRELQRRLDARRERERRRLPDIKRQYQFSPATPGETHETPAASDSAEFAGAGGINSATATAPRTSRTPLVREAASRHAPRPFSEYRQEYAHVFGDLRRIVLVVGGLLLLLVALSFVVRG